MSINSSAVVEHSCLEKIIHTMFQYIFYISLKIQYAKKKYKHKIIYIFKFISVNVRLSRLAKDKSLVKHLDLRYVIDT